MKGPLIAIVGDITAGRTLVPPLKDPAKAQKAAEDLGAQLARRGARLLVYGGPFLEADVVRGFVAGSPTSDGSVLMWYSQDQVPPAFAEESAHPKLFTRRAEKGSDWETAFYRSIGRSDGVILIGGDKATTISGQVAIGSRLPILALSEFGGGAKRVWDTLSAGEDLPSRDEIDVMARPWSDGSAAACVDALFEQYRRRKLVDGAPHPVLSILAASLFVMALAIVPWIFGKNQINVWMLFLAPLLAGGSGAAIRPLVDRLRGAPSVGSSVLATIVLGLVAGGIAGVFFVTAQLTGDPNLAEANVADYARRSIPFSMGVGFLAGLSADSVFGKLLGLDVVRTTGIGAELKRQ